jgi:L-fucose/D-arabinose isomerase
MRPVAAGLVTFDFPPGYRRADVAVRPTASGSPLSKLLQEAGAAVVNPVESRFPAGIPDAAASAACADALRAARVDCLLIDVFHWSQISLAAQLVREVGVPAAVFANTGDGWNGVPAATAISGSIREAPPTRAAALIERFIDTHPQELAPWLTAARALASLRRSRLMLWGGSYGAEMPYTRSDPAEIERLLVAEVMSEQESVLVERARAILSGARPRVEGFQRWLRDGGASVVFDGRMLTPEALDFQTALYLAARDRLTELAPAAPGGVIAASLKCHYEMSISPVGCTGCLLPAFLPFGVDSEGERPVVPFACEGDLNALAGLALLHALNPAVPPLFGDLVSYRGDHVLLRNCGAASVHWAGRSASPAVSLPRVTLRGNIHGRSGAAVGYETPAGGPVTFARLFRQDGEFILFLGEAAVEGESEGSRYSDPWPHTRLSFPSDHHLLYRAAPCNHGSLTEGALAGAAETLSAHAGIRVVRCDRDESLAGFLRDAGAPPHGRGAGR